MLEELQVSNLALMTSASLLFEPGFTAVTGETGAGKSVLLGALGILAGNRVDKTVIRQGKEACEVAATLFFADPTLINIALESLDLPACEEGALVLRRVIRRERAAKIQVNGAMATLAALQTLSEHWIDFHGPGEPQKLFKPQYQLELLDGYARLLPERAEYQSIYTGWRACLQEAEELRQAERLSEDEQDFLRQQLARIDAVEVSEAGVSELERDFQRLDKARELSELAAQLSEGLGGDNGVVNSLGALQRAAQELTQIDTESAPLAERLDAVIIELQDLVAEYAQLADVADIEPEAAESLQQRMAAWLELKRKYGPEPEQVLAQRQQIADKLAAQGDTEGALQKLATEAAAMEQSLKERALMLTQQRRQVADKLSEEVRRSLVKLGFKKAGFTIEIIDEPELTAMGDSCCSFKFSPNAGQELLPLNRIASSGETARVMLALKAVMAKADKTPLLVFDEVDANVGGEIGAEVGREMAALSGNHQVLCVTHLPQVAAQAQQHLVVVKDQDEESTSVSISSIHGTEQEREAELARMLGDRSSASAREHARALLQG
ncbi:MAG: DNA repair protein RecN [Verrucomicrobiota bacterium]